MTGDRYEHLVRHANLGEGQDEPSIRRFTRWSDYVGGLDKVADQLRVVENELTTHLSRTAPWRSEVIDGVRDSIGQLELITDHLEASTIFNTQNDPGAPATNACAEVVTNPSSEGISHV